VDEGSLAHLLKAQEGIVARRQLLENGANPHDIRRLLRRRGLARVHPGVYANHTGPLTWRQRAWAGVLYAGPEAALDAESALHAEHGTCRGHALDDARINVAVDATRTVKNVDGIRIRRVAALAGKVRWSSSPPRLRVEDATLHAALDTNDLHARYEVLASSVRSRSTTAQRLIDVVNARARLPHRRWLLAALIDLRDGSCSVLEREYLTKVERAHGLPRSRRQPPDRDGEGRRVYRDVVYEEFGTFVELDGRVHEDPEQRDQDLERDLDLAVEERAALRLGWRQVVRRSCRTAARIGRLLQRRGWLGTLAACGPECPIGRDSD
jgi:hypothetical protein